MMEEIIIQVDPTTAKLYKAAPWEKQQKMQMLLSLWLQEAARTLEKEKPSLETIMDQMSEKAVTRGLTPEILAAILNEK